ncbi:MAG: 23S rRNA (adenine(2503)-C(2))-methyltransferase RlmN [Lachnospiraceae bacterium]|nr:23S rRNA (adenine(2503)-C(2))-methyltransferase RlmN [Lachnospiraceae bacterium]
MSEKSDLRAKKPDDIAAWVRSAGEPSYRAGQIFGWIHKKRCRSIEDMTDLPKDLRRRLAEEFAIYEAVPVKVLESKIDGTRKYLNRLSDGNVIETVLLKYEYGWSICISSQVGCRMGCRFCASGMDGLVRNLTAGEMAGQVYAAESDINERIGHIVVMGSGEPLDNYESFTDFLDIMTDGKGAGISARNITASTCGLVPGIRALADRKYSITLALSLHAVTDEKRRQIMPIANRYALDEVISACRYYRDVTGRRLTLEYSLIEGFNDGDDDMEGLAEISRELKAHVNLIPVNPVDGAGYRAASRRYAETLKNKLEKNNINVTIRREMGRDISGACGQLRRGFINDAALGEQNV